MEIFQNIWHNQKKNQGDHSEEILPKYKENGLTKTEIVEAAEETAYALTVCVS